MRALVLFYTATKRTLKNPLFLLMLAALCFCVLFFGSIEKDISLPKTGVALIDDDPEAIALFDRLCADGFIAYENEALMCEAIQRGDISIGISPKEDLSERMKAGEVEGATKLFCTPTTSFVQITSLRVSAHLSDIYAPYLTERLMDGHGIELSHEEVREYMDECYESDAHF